jgi:hypothetical protein
VSFSLPPRNEQTDSAFKRDVYEPPQVDPMARQRRIAKRLAIFIAAPLAAVFALAMLIVLFGSPPPAPVIVAPPAPTALAPIPTLPPPAVAVPRPANSFGAGIYEVGNGSGQMSPGKYTSTGPGPGIHGYCYYARLRDSGGQLDSIIANVNTLGPAVVTVKPTDAAFEIQGDCVFAKVS